MTLEERIEVYKKLAEPFPPETVERTEGRLTKKGYDTAGIKYQYVVNRLNEVLGVGCFRAHRNISVKESLTNSNRTAYEARCELVLELGSWNEGQFVVFAEAIADGGHVSMNEADARKGCYTNAFKKAAAFFGCGRQAYEGTLDDDNLPVEDVIAEKRPVPESVKPGNESNGSPAPKNGRKRITAKQLAAIWAMSRQSGHEQGQVRGRIKELYSVQPEFLTMEQASAVIDRLKAKTNGVQKGEV